MGHQSGLLARAGRRQRLQGRQGASEYLMSGPHAKGGHAAVPYKLWESPRVSKPGQSVMRLQFVKPSSQIPVSADGHTFSACQEMSVSAPDRTF